MKTNLMVSGKMNGITNLQINDNTVKQVGTSTQETPKKVQSGVLYCFMSIFGGE